jgi:hypothetical protein
MVKICAILTLLVATAVPVLGQDPDPDSLVTAFLQHGRIGSGGWSPAAAFQGCPDLQPWQRQAFRLLQDVRMDLRRESDLAASLAGPFAACGDPELQRWYLERLEAHETSDPVQPHWYWKGLDRADDDLALPSLYRWMTDSALPARFRAVAGGKYFARLEGDERLEAFVAAYERGLLPTYTAGYFAQTLIRERPDATLARLAGVIREQPGRIGDDPLMELLLLPDTWRSASPTLRARFVADVRAALAATEMAPERRKAYAEALQALDPAS